MGVSKAVYNGKTLIDLTQDTVTETKLLSGYTAHKADGTIINGGITTKQAATYTPTTTDQTFAEDEYLYGNVVLKGDPNLLAANIKAGVTIFGVTGTAKSSKPQPIDNIENILPLSVARSALAAATIGNYALFTGGNGNYSMKTTVDAYDTTLTRTLPSSLGTATYYHAGVGNGSHALFAGHYNYVYGSAYDTSLTRRDISLSKASQMLAAAAIGNYALFAGGNGSSNGIVDAFNSSLTRVTVSELGYKASSFSGSSNSSYAIFGGGNRTSNVTAYDSSLTKYSVTNLSIRVTDGSASGFPENVIFAGGYGNDSTNNCIDLAEAYNTNLTKSILDNLSVPRRKMAATKLGDFVMFGGGMDSNGDYNVVDAYSYSLVHNVFPPLLKSVSILAATSVGNYAIFGGGSCNLKDTDAISVYSI